MNKKRIAGIALISIFSLIIIWLLFLILRDYHFGFLIFCIIIIIPLLPLLVLGIALTISKMPVKFDEVLDIDIKFLPMIFVLITAINFVLSMQKLFFISFVINSLILMIGLIVSCIIIKRKAKEEDIFAEIAINIAIFGVIFFIYPFVAWGMFIPLVNLAM